MRRRRGRTPRWLLTAAALFALAAGGATSSVSAGEPSSGDVDPRATVSARERYRDSLLDPTFDVLAQQPGFQVGGLHPIDDAIVVYWNGGFGPEARRAVEDSHRRGVPVIVVHVPYSYEALRQIAGPLVESLAAKGIALDGYRIGDPFDEITVWGMDLEGSADARRVAEDTAADLLPSDLRLRIVMSPDPLVPMAAGSATLDRADGHRVAFPGRWRLAR